jgi:ribosome modulation factor
MEEGMEEEGMLEFDIPEEGEEYIEIGDDPEAMLTALGDISRERKDWKERTRTRRVQTGGSTKSSGLCFFNRIKVRKSYRVPYYRR